MIYQAFELREKKAKFEIVELQEPENDSEEIPQNLGPIIVEASSIKNDFCYDKSKKLFSSKDFLEKPGN